MASMMEVRHDKFSKEWDYNLSEEEAKQILARLDSLEQIATHIQVLRESYTRQLVVAGFDENGKKKASSDSKLEELKKELNNEITTEKTSNKIIKEI